MTNDQTKDPRRHVPNPKGKTSKKIPLKRETLRGYHASARGRKRQHIGCITIVVPDYDQAKQYYNWVLGFDLIEDTPLKDGKRWVVVAPRGNIGARLLLARASSPQQRTRIGNQTGGRVFLFLYTDDFWRDYRELQARGVTFCDQPRDEVYGMVSVFEDIYGNRWDLIQSRSSDV